MKDITFQRIAQVVYSSVVDEFVHPNELIDILAELLLPAEEPIEGPPVSEPEPR